MTYQKYLTSKPILKTFTKMKKDNFKTKVIFLYNKQENDLFAFFPGTLNKLTNKAESYAHMGQHSPCHIDYAKESKFATKKQYHDLFIELENIGYNLQITKTF